MPLISVCINAEPDEQYLEEAINSVLKQTFSDFELLVCGSESGKSWTIAQTAAEKDARVRLIKFSSSKQATALNLALRNCRGTWVQFLSAKDSLAPNCLQAFAQVLAVSSATVTVVSCAYHLITGDGTAIETVSFDDANTIVSGHSVTKRSLLELNSPFKYLSAIIFRKENALSGMDERFFLLSDFEFFCRLAAQGDCLFLSQALCSVRKFAHQTQDNRTKESLLWLHDYILLRECFSKFLEKEKVDFDAEDFYSQYWSKTGGITHLHMIQQISDQHRFRITAEEALAAAKELSDWDEEYILQCYIRLVWQMSDSLHWLNHWRSEAVAEARAKAQRAHQRGREEMRAELIAQVHAASSEKERLQVEVDELHKQLSRLKEDHSSILESSSWRLTAPIRRLRAGLINGRSVTNKLSK